MLNTNYINSQHYSIRPRTHNGIQSQDLSLTKGQLVTNELFLCLKSKLSMLSMSSSLDISIMVWSFYILLHANPVPSRRQPGIMSPYTPGREDPVYPQNSFSAPDNLHDRDGHRLELPLQKVQQKRLRSQESKASVSAVSHKSHTLSLLDQLIPYPIPKT